MYKIKTNWYFTINKALDHIKKGSERRLWMSILNEEYDDIKSHLSNSYREYTDEFAFLLNEQIIKTVQSLYERVKENISLDKKDFASWVNSLPSYEKKLIWRTRSILQDEKIDSNEHTFMIRKELVDYILGNLKSKKQWETMIPLVGDIRLNKSKLDALLKLEEVNNQEMGNDDTFSRRYTFKQKQIRCIA